MSHNEEKIFKLSEESSEHLITLAKKATKKNAVLFLCNKIACFYQMCNLDLIIYMHLHTYII